MCYNRAVKISLMRVLDLLLGWPLLLLVRLVQPLLPRPAAGGRARILVIKFLGLGSVVLATPLLQRLRTRHPAAELTLLTFADKAALAQLYPVIDAAVAIDASSFAVFVRDTLRFLWRERHRSFTLVCDLEFFSYYSALLAVLVGGGVRRGFRSFKPLRDALYDLNLPLAQDRHMAATFAAFAGGTEPVTELPRPLMPASEAERIDRWLATVPGTPATRLLVNINATELCLQRRWPPDRFAALLRALLADYPDAICLLIGSPAEHAYAAQLAAQFMEHTRVVNLAGATGLLQLTALLGAARLLVSNDSGPLHLAAACGLPCVALFGPESPHIYGPVGRGHHVIFLGLPCSPCLNIFRGKVSHCRDNRCLADISVDRVRAAVQACWVPS